MDAIKKLSCYLPYALNFYGGGDIFTMYSISKDGDVLLKNGLDDVVLHKDNVGGEYAPILRPMSDFLLSDRYICDAAVPSEVHGIHKDITRIAYRIDWLLQNHYDIFGLIDQKKAIDISSLR